MLMLSPWSCVPLLGQAPPLPIEEMPLAQYGAASRGATVTPAYEGWYPHPDGGYVLYFGYYNRNTEEVVRLPVGTANSITGPWQGVDAGQPTVFQPGRAWGVFGVRVPPSFADTVVWTLTVHGTSISIPGHLGNDWMVPGIAGDVMGNRPPRIRFSGGSEEGAGPLGLASEPRRARVGFPETLEVWASDDGKLATQFSRGDANAAASPVTVTWLEHRGPGPVTFEPPSTRVPNQGGSAKTQVTFTQPGTYVLRARVNDDSGVAAAGYEQCCWTNGFIEFTVSP
jgi:hypothetical protein